MDHRNEIFANEKKNSGHVDKMNSESSTPEIKAIPPIVPSPGGNFNYGWQFDDAFGVNRDYESFSAQLRKQTAAAMDEDKAEEDMAEDNEISRSSSSKNDSFSRFPHEDAVDNVIYPAVEQIPTLHSPLGLAEPVRGRLAGQQGGSGEFSLPSEESSEVVDGGNVYGNRSPEATRW